MRQKHGRWTGLGLALLLGGTPVLAGPAVQATPAVKASPARDADSAFFIARSTNRNQVHYGLRVDDDCRPQGDKPVHAYWRMLEKGAQATEPLLGREGPAYGLGDMQQVEATASGWRVHLRLRAWPERTTTVDVFREGGRQDTGQDGHSTPHTPQSTYLLRFEDLAGLEPWLANC